jgi:hypothetical protein
MAINEFVTLKCDCKGELFSPVVKLRHKAEGGTISEPAGHRCVACGAVVDNAYMIRLIDIQRKRSEADRLVAEATALEKSVPPKTAKEVAPAGRN